MEIGAKGSNADTQFKLTNNRVTVVLKCPGSIEIHLSDIPTIRQLNAHKL